MGMRRIMGVRRVLCLALILTLSCCLAAPVHAAYDGAVDSYSFDLRFQLYPEAFPKSLREKMEGYASFVNDARLTGVFSVTDTPGYFDLQANLFPTSSSKLPVSFRIYGTQAILVITSPLLGNEVLFLNTPGLLAFGSKSYSHLSLPLQYLALAIPYTWELSFLPLTEAWEEEIGFQPDPGPVPAEAISAVAERWSDALTNDLYLNEWLIAVSQENQEAAQPLLADFEALPEYLRTKAAAGGLEVIRDGEDTVWKNGNGETLFRLWNRVDYYGWMMDLPVTSSNYKPYGSYERTEFEDTFHFDIQAYDRSADGSQPDLLTFRAYGDDLPAVWPAETDFNAHLFLMGSLFPNIALSAVGSCHSDGSFSAALFKPIVPSQESTEIFRVEGTAEKTSPAELADFDPAAWMFYRNVLSLNDSSMGEFVENVARPLISGALHFLIDVPVSFCQSLMDDLTDSGILGLVLSK